MIALSEDTIKAGEAGAPVLVGTPAVALSEKLAGVLASNHFSFYLLNARYTNYEAELIAMAGYPGRITIATNMAGRGTDIKPGGSLESHLPSFWKREDWLKGLTGEHLSGTERLKMPGKVIRLPEKSPSERVGRNWSGFLNLARSQEGSL